MHKNGGKEEAKTKDGETTWKGIYKNWELLTGKREWTRDSAEWASSEIWWNFQWISAKKRELHILLLHEISVISFFVCNCLVIFNCFPSSYKVIQQCCWLKNVLENERNNAPLLQSIIFGLNLVAITFHVLLVNNFWNISPGNFCSLCYIVIFCNQLKINFVL